MYREGKELITTTDHPCLPKWRGRIDEAERRGYFTDKDIDDAAHSNACATWEAHEKYGISYDSGPQDETLWKLGHYFRVFVAAHNFAACRETIAAIERRLRELA